jgi:hypothetical protein
VTLSTPTEDEQPILRVELDIPNSGLEKYIQSFEWNITKFEQRKYDLSAQEH